MLPLERLPAPLYSPLTVAQFPSIVAAPPVRAGAVTDSAPFPCMGDRIGWLLVPPLTGPSRKLYAPVASEKSRQSVASTAIAIVPVVTPARSRLASIRVRSFATFTVRVERTQAVPDHAYAFFEVTWPYVPVIMIS